MFVCFVFFYKIRETYIFEVHDVTLKLFFSLKEDARMSCCPHSYSELTIVLLMCKFHVRFVTPICVLLF